MKPILELSNAPFGAYIASYEIWLIHHGDTIKRYWEDASLDTILVSNPITLEKESRIVQTASGFRDATIEGPELFEYVLKMVKKLTAGDVILIQNVRIRQPSRSNLLLPGPYVFYIKAS